MRLSIVRHLGFAVAALVLTLVVPALIRAQGIPPIPHPLQGRTDCLVCHETGVVGATQIPNDHAGRTDDLCQSCHQPTGAIASIPHPLEGRADCLACHGTGVGQAGRIPEDHSNRTNEMCQDCHQAAAEGAASATPAAGPPTEAAPPDEEPQGAPEGGIPAIPHTLEGRADCLMCHQTGAGGAPQFPADHAGRTSDMCRGCHQPAAGTAAASATPPAGPPAEAAPEEEPQGAPEGGIPAIPHPLEGRADCLMCHQTGAGGAPPFPADHAGRTSDMCRGCHQPAAGAAAASATPAAGPPAEAAPEEEPQGAPEGGIPAIPHPLEGRADCLMCHQTGAGGAPQFPADHAGRTSDMCRGCHQPATEVTPTAASPATTQATAAAPGTAPTEASGIPTIPHPLEGRDKCLDCHGTGLSGFPQAPADHAGRTDDICRGCHQPSVEVSHGQVSRNYPVIPHPLEARADCRACHATGAGAPKFPANHTDWPSTICRDCHSTQPPASVQGNCLDCHIMPGEAVAPTTNAPSAGPPAIPHPLAKYEDCLGCHQGGVGGAPLTPDNHTGRTNDVCQSCHQPAPPAPPTAVPTPIAQYPFSARANSCRDCHSTLTGKKADVVGQWERSVHSQVSVSCPDCHGGDPSATTKEKAMSPDAKYIGVPDKTAIPALCASCHADVARMRQYDVPTDQSAKYAESVHGILLGRGDRNVATCFDCHGGHEILKANDPASTVYPLNVPAMCAGCHADQSYMAGYQIPTDQYDLYRQSVHGRVLLDDQDVRAPTCATCHGTHGATPPGVDEVANVCGTCHSATRDYYVKSPHAQAGRGAPECVTCHGRHDVATPSEAIFVGAGPRQCGACHAPSSAPGRLAQSLAVDLTGAAQAYSDAETAIQSARSLGMLVGPLEARLRQANTDLVTARAAQHTLDIAAVRERVNPARAVADETKTAAASLIGESVFRRLAMVVAVAVIGLIILALIMLKREIRR